MELAAAGVLSSIAVVGGIAMVTDAGCIAAADLLAGNVFHSASQPHFQDLVESMRSSARPLVIIAGAGVSMSVGFPSWKELVERLERKLIDPEILRVHQRNNSDDLQRRADTVLLEDSGDPARPKTVAHIREALYSHNYWEREPGAIAPMIAQLAAVSSRRVSVLTTNYDEVLDAAMSEAFVGESSSFTFQDWEEWSDLEDDRHRAAVMHLHGLIPAVAGVASGPLVLTESDFLVHGEEIQSKLIDLFSSSDVLLIGMSLADQNITVPLFKSKHLQTDRFIATTEVLDGLPVSPEQAANVAVWLANSTKSRLQIKPILLKHYAQIAQLLTECSLATSEPDFYRKPMGDSTANGSDAAGLHPVASRRPPDGGRGKRGLDYETRFNSVLYGAYEALGISGADGLMDQDDSIALSLAFNELVFGDDGPDCRLKQLRMKYRGRCAEDENIELLLWLSDLPWRREVSRGLRLILSSSSAQLRPGSPCWVEAIRHDSPNPAIQAAFHGFPVFSDTSASRISGPWRSAFAIPLLVQGSASDRCGGGLPVDVVHLGAIAVNSDRGLHDPSDLRGGSVLGLLKDDELDFFRRGMEDVVTKLFA